MGRSSLALDCARATLGLVCVVFAGACASTTAAKPAAPTRPVRILEVPIPTPLGGAPLILSRVGDPEIQGMPPDKCSFWPILDTYRLIADPNRVCVSAELFRMNTESGALPISKLDLGLSSASQPPTYFEVTTAGMKNAGRCYGKDALRTTVWKYQFVGCTPNQGLVTEYTQTLLLQQKEGEELARWRFTDARAAPAAVVATRPQAQPQPAPSSGEFTPTPFPTQGAQPAPPPPPPPPPQPQPQPVAGPPPRPRPAAPQPSPQARQLYTQGAQLLAQRYYGDAMEKFSQCLDLEPGPAVG